MNSPPIGRSPAGAVIGARRSQRQRPPSPRQRPQIIRRRCLTPAIFLLLLLLHLVIILPSHSAWGDSAPPLETIEGMITKRHSSDHARRRHPLPSPNTLFAQWINRTQADGGPFVNRSAYSEGEVLLFRTKKNRHRAASGVAVMGQHSRLHSTLPSSPSPSKFSDALTFKEWLRRVYSQEKVLKVSIRSNEGVRPVLQHLYAARDRFRAPIIIHANTFDGGRSTSSERPVDPVLLIETAARLLPQAVLSLGWTPSASTPSLKTLDWTKTFELLTYIHALHQPVMLNMGVREAANSVGPLEWLLGLEEPPVYLLAKGSAADWVDAEQERGWVVGQIARLQQSARHQKVILDVDYLWKGEMESGGGGSGGGGGEGDGVKDKRSVEQGGWRNLLFPNPHAMLSTSVISSESGDVAFVGWPNSLLLSSTPESTYPSKQRVSGKVMFLPKRHSSREALSRDSGLLLHLFEGDATLLDSPIIEGAIKIFIGFNGRVSIENHLRRSRAGGEVGNTPPKSTKYHKSTTAQLPIHPCYAFEVVDRGWRVELEVWTFEKGCDADRSAGVEGEAPLPSSYRTYLQLDTPIATNRRSRHVAVGKSGDGAIDFLLQELRHDGTPRVLVSIRGWWWLILMTAATVLSIAACCYARQ